MEASMNTVSPLYIFDQEIMNISSMAHTYTLPAAIHSSFAHRDSYQQFILGLNLLSACH
jgi:hypothetical protein